MTVARPTPAQVRAQALAVREKVPKARAVGIRFQGPWDGPPRLQVGGEPADVACSDSVLQIREWLSKRPEGAGLLILLTGLEEADLGGDVLARVAKRRLFQVDRWRIVRDLFQARDVDPILAGMGWIADVLIEHAPPGGYPPVPSGVLDSETVWRIVLAEGLGLRTATPDAVDLIRWSMNQEATERFRAAQPALREGAREWVRRTAGAAGAAILDCVVSGHAADTVPVGLASQVVFDPAAREVVALREAAVRLERFHGGPAVAREAGPVWALAAGQVAMDLAAKEGIGAVRPWLDRADAILEEVGAQPYAHLGHLSLKGFEQRLERYGRALATALRADPVAVSDELEREAADVFRHALAGLEPERCRRVEMSLRLARWLVTVAGPMGEAQSLAQAAEGYARHGSFVDWARLGLRGVEPLQGLSQAYSRLIGAATERREQKNRRFAHLLAEWSKAPSSGQRVLPIEAVLATVVVPLARVARALLVVIDGMSLAVYRELLEDLAAKGWLPLHPGGQGDLPPVLAALPTITEVSRASLLAGRVTSGTGPSEKEAFARHPGLVAVSRVKAPPVVFHRAELTEGDGTQLAAPVRAAVAAPDRQVVAVVINAVDDHLLKAAQVCPRWTLDYFQTLGALLHAAREAERVVVLASDHGHVLDAETHLQRYDQGDRWRADDGAPGPDEVVLSGPRVMTPLGSRVIVPWSERTRYGNQKNGYHGGASPQEVVVPLAVLTFAGADVEGWTEARMDYPSWWQVAQGAPPSAAPSQRPTAPPPPIEPGTNLAFEFGPRPPVAAAEGAWIDALFASPVYGAQKRLAGRQAPPDDRVRAFLGALDERGGKLTRAALVHRLGLAPVRLTGLIAAMRRLLNVEGYPVLGLDEASDTVELNRELLAVQFGIEG